MYFLFLWIVGRPLVNYRRYEHYYQTKSSAAKQCKSPAENAVQHNNRNIYNPRHDFFNKNYSIKEKIVTADL
jgi:hypothetical protein